MDDREARTLTKLTIKFLVLGLVLTIAFLAVGVPGMFPYVIVALGSFLGVIAALSSAWLLVQHYHVHVQLERLATDTFEALNTKRVGATLNSKTSLTGPLLAPAYGTTTMNGENVRAPPSSSRPESPGSDELFSASNPTFTVPSSASNDTIDVRWSMLSDNNMMSEGNPNNTADVCDSAPSPSHCALYDCCSPDVVIRTCTERRYVMRLICMVTWYATASVVSLWLPRIAPILEEVKNVYEGFITFTFSRFLIGCFDFPLTQAYQLPRSAMTAWDDEAQRNGEPLIAKELEMPHGYFGCCEDRVGNRMMWWLWPSLCHVTRKQAEQRLGMPAMGGRCFCLRTLLWRLLSQRVVIRIARQFLTVFLFVNPILLILTAITLHLDVYHDGVISTEYAYLYIYAARVMFLTPALFPLVIMLAMSRTTLADKSPVKKFATVKIVVFIGVWQRLLLTVLHKYNWLPKALPEATAVPILNNYLMCFETCVLCAINYLVFPAVTPSRSVPRDALFHHHHQARLDGPPQTKKGLAYFLSLNDVMEEVHSQLCC